jgi:hypothetical protein
MPAVSPSGQLSKSRIETAALSAANTLRDGTGTIVDVLVAGGYGSAVTSIDITATGTTTAGAVRIFLHNGSAYKFIAEVLVTAITPALGVQAPFSTTWTPPVPAGTFGSGVLVVPNGWKLAMSTNNAETFNVTAKGLDY